MKKILLALLILSCISGFAQIKQVENKKPTGTEIGKIQPMGQPVHISIYKQDDIYVFTYKDSDFVTMDVYQSFMFKDIDNAYQSFYEMIMKGFEDMPEEEIKLELEHQFVWLKFSKRLGIKLVTFKSTESKTEGARVISSKEFNKKQIEKLFGKK
jgi:hypothetical protein